ncbi:glycosyltransferase family 2 protein [Phragmitibacter flavus]|uniref:Glycosyltransferase family 2 protein n=1 Tax=Phragmitibacter flavus TaxID=2576071 RepID=A0A5R8KCH2_9BACT|nr:glycosyltransferase family 2 protein [Phragmitibacter flavus]TLD69937.1 glycosyltransferase family 2 protein [Phragmitibacter flavus]
MSLPVSICIPVRNEEKNLPDCLASLGEFDEVVVVDSGSSDRTVEIARAAGATVLRFEWDGGFPKKRNWALRNHVFKHPWVLFLDADERMNTAMVNELGKTLPNTTHSGFWISFTNWFMGRPLHHGDVFHKLSLFRVGHGEYERFPEEFWSRLDMEIHEHPVLQGSVGELRTRLEHYDYRGLENYFARHNEYSTWEANRYQWFKRQASAEDWAKLNTRQRFKYRHLDKWWLGTFYFLMAYLAKKGFLDGYRGWIFNRLKQRYFADIRLKILEMESGKSSN